MSEKEREFTGKKNELLKDFGFIGFMDNLRGDLENTLQLRYPDMDWQMNRYMERANENDPTCVRVDMDNGKRIDFSDKLGEKDEVIFTYGLCGCIVAGLVLEMNDGTEKAILTHNSPLNIGMGGSTICRLGANIKPEEVKKAKVFILAPGEAKQNSEGKLEQRINQQSEMYSYLLETSAKLVGGVNTEVERIGYSKSRIIGAKNQGTFRIVRDMDGKVRFIVEDFYPSGEVFS